MLFSLPIMLKVPVRKRRCIWSEKCLASFTRRTCLAFPSLSLQPLCHLLCVMLHYAPKINWLLCVGWQLYHWIQFWTETSVHDQRRRTAAQICTAGLYQSFRAGRWRCLCCRWWNVWFRLELGHGFRCAVLHSADSAVITNYCYFSWFTVS